MNLENLKNMPLEDIRALATKMNVKWHPRSKAETIAAAIVDQTLNVKPPQDREMQHKAEKPQEAPEPFTEDEIKEAIKPYTDKGLNAVFPGDGTWIFSFKGAEESGNMAIPLREIKSKAASVSRGALRFKGVKGDGTVGKGYADNILIG